MYKACGGRLSSVSGTGKELVGLEHVLSQQIKLTLVFLYLFLAVPVLCCSARTFSSCGKQGPLSSCDTRVSHCDGFSCCRAQALEHMGSVVVVHVLSFAYQVLSCTHTHTHSDRYSHVHSHV